MIGDRLAETKPEILTQASMYARDGNYENLPYYKGVV